MRLRVLTSKGNTTDKYEEHDYIARDGVLTIHHVSGHRVKTYAPGYWLSVEILTEPSGTSLFSGGTGV